MQTPTDNDPQESSPVESWTDEALRVKVGKLSGVKPRITYMVSNNGTSGCMFTGSHCEAQGWLDKIRTAYPDGWIDETYSVMPIENWPDYPNDLNAINKAMRYAIEHLMDADQWGQFGRELERQRPMVMLNYEGTIDYYELATLITELGPRHYCIAFIKTLCPPSA